MKLRTISTFFYLIISIPIFLFFHENVFIWLSFFINYSLITYITYYHLNKEKVYSPFMSSYLVFNFLFFIVAPMLQISSIEKNDFTFINGFPYQVWDIVLTNILILLFNVFFFWSYIILKKKYLKPKKQKQLQSYVTPLLILILFVISLVILFSNIDFISDETFSSVYTKNEVSVFSQLIRKKVLFLVPLGAIIITYKYIKTNKINTNTVTAFIIIVALLFVLLIFKNPLIEKRNALGPIYITLIYLFYPKIINSNVKTFLFLFLSMVFMFPILSALTHIDLSLNDIVANPQLVFYQFLANGGILETFNTLNYDAFANIMATVEYVDQHGFSFGYQLLSAFLFFVPRSVWISKPHSTGEVVGNYLIEQHNFSFSNLSNPVVSEGYINFGIIGVVLMAITLSFFIVNFIKWLYSPDSLKEIMAFYFAIHLIFLLRGDFTNGFVYFIGTFIGVFIIPKFIWKSLKIIFKRS